MSGSDHQQPNLQIEILSELKKLNAKIEGINNKVDVLHDDVAEVTIAARKSGAIAGAVAGGISGGLIATGIALLKASFGGG